MHVTSVIFQKQPVTGLVWPGATLEDLIGYYGYETTHEGRRRKFLGYLFVHFEVGHSKAVLRKIRPAFYQIAEDEITKRHCTHIYFTEGPHE